MKIIRGLDPTGRILTATQEPDGRNLRIRGDLFGEWEVTTETVRIAKLLTPIVPTQILCIGLNYRRHAEETGAKFPAWPVLFQKSLNILLAPDDPILLPSHLRSREVDFEGELAVVVGRDCKNVPRDKAFENILGYTCGNDVSARDWQKQHGGGQWCRGKSFDTFAPLGPCLVTKDEIPNPNSLNIRTLVNGEILQDCNTSDMIFDVLALIEFLSGSTTLIAGTVILTGTPHGVGMARIPPRWLQAGDTVTIEIQDIGQLTNPVAEEPVSGIT